jgi:hypothetical protein
MSIDEDSMPRGYNATMYFTPSTARPWPANATDANPRAAAMRVFSALLFVLLLAAPSARANDGMAELRAGGIEILQSGDIALLEEDLFLSADEVRVRFLFRNESRIPISTLVAFVAPDLGQEDIDSRALFGVDELEKEMKFTALVDGKAVQIFTNKQAIPNEDDLTTKMEIFGDAADRMEAQPSASWKLRIRFYWRQVFPPGQEVEVVHRYRPFSGSMITRPHELKFVDGDWNSARDYCFDEAQMHGAQRLADAAKQRLGYETLYARFLSYILTTGAGWRGPIRRLSITIDSGHPDAVLASCLTDLKRMGPREYALEWRNVKPTDDIRLMFLLPADW